MLEWDALRVVLAVHRRGSMSGAAELLSVDPGHRDPAARVGHSQLCRMLAG